VLIEESVVYSHINKKEKSTQMTQLQDVVLLNGEKPVMLLSNVGIMSVLLGMVAVGMFALIVKLITSDSL
jgi:hypothetical protein